MGRYKFTYSIIDWKKQVTAYVVNFDDNSISIPQPLDAEEYIKKVTNYGQVYIILAKLKKAKKL